MIVSLPGLPMTFVTAPPAGSVTDRFAVAFTTCDVPVVFRLMLIPPAAKFEKSSVSPVAPAGSFSMTLPKVFAGDPPTK